MSVLPCTTHPDDFLQPGEDPDWGTREPAKRAVASCLFSCPRLAECAREALEAGSTGLELPGGSTVSAPAVGVVQAGIVCRGDMATRRALLLVAGVRSTDEACVACLRSFEEVTRKARGLCSGCYTAARRSGSVVVSRPRFQTPEACVDCEAPMVPFGKPRPEGHVEHRSGGRCHTCDMRRRRSIRIAA